MGKIITIDEIQEGMILDEPVLNSFGQTLLNKGASLSQKHKIVFQTWNIKSLKIKSDEEDSENEFSPEQLELSEKNLKIRLNWQPRNLVEKDLYNSAIILFARHLFRDQNKIKVNY